LGLSRNKVAVPEGVAGTPPFWSHSQNIPIPSCNIRNKSMQSISQMGL
jgi:hypothetical protein